MSEKLSPPATRYLFAVAHRDATGVWRCPPEGVRAATVHPLRRRGLVGATDDGRATLTDAGREALCAAVANDPSEACADCTACGEPYFVELDDGGTELCEDCRDPA